MTNHETAFDGCNRECRKAGKHTLRWGGCEHAAKPEPTVSMSKIYKDPEDGLPSIGFDTYTVAQLGELITAGLRASDLPVNGDDLVDIGVVAAHAIVHRNDGAAPAAVSVPPPAPRADDLRWAADRLADEIMRGARFSHEDARQPGLAESVTLLRRWADEAGEQQNETPEAEAPVVAYRSRDSRSLYCTAHAGELFGLSYEPVTAEDLPDGGICTYPDCGRDVLAEPRP